MSKIYFISDIHLMHNRMYEGIDNLILNNLKNFLSTCEKDSLVVLCGDTLNYSMIKSTQNNKIMGSFTKLLKYFNQENGLSFVILGGNHDILEVVEDKNNFMNSYGFFNVIYPICDDFITFCLTPDVITYDNTNLFLLPYAYEYDYDKINKLFAMAPNEKNNILVCHDATIEEVALNNNVHHIDFEKIEHNFNAIIKGHTHQAYNVKEDSKNCNLYSPGSFVKLKEKDSSSYLVFDTDVNDFNKALVVKEFTNRANIRFVNMLLDDDNVNEVLSSLNSNCICNLIYNGDKGTVDNELFTRAFKSCIIFNFIFTKDEEFEVIEEDVEGNFPTLKDYLKNKLDPDVFNLYNKIVSVG